MADEKAQKKKKRSKPKLTLAHLEELYDVALDVCEAFRMDCKEHPFLAHWRRLWREIQQQATIDSIDPKQVFRVLSHPIATFSLLTRNEPMPATIHVPESGDFARNVSPRPLLKPDFLVESEQHVSCSRVGACKLRSSTYSKYGGEKDTDKCHMLRNHQFHTRITLKPRNLCTLFEGKWVDSAVMDAWLYGLHCSFPHAKRLYIISAEDDPDLDLLRYTDGCYDYILTVLYFRDHWTCMFINHRCREIFYYNSQLSYKTAEAQLEPWKQKFPDYAIEIPRVPQQDDKFSCGVFVCWYIYCLLFCPELIQSLNCAQSQEMRQAILRQLIVWYIL